MDEGKELGLTPRKDSHQEAKKMEFDKLPTHVRKTRTWQKILLETVDHSEPKPDGFLDMEKIDRDALSEYYRRKATQFSDEALPDEIRNDVLFRDDSKAFGREVALKQYFYREDLEIEEREEINKILEERQRKKKKLD